MAQVFGGSEGSSEAPAVALPGSGGAPAGMDWDLDVDAFLDDVRAVCVSLRAGIVPCRTTGALVPTAVLCVVGSACPPPAAAAAAAAPVLPAMTSG